MIGLRLRCYILTTTNAHGLLEATNTQHGQED